MKSRDGRINLSPLYLRGNRGLPVQPQSQRSSPASSWCIEMTQDTFFSHHVHLITYWLLGGEEVQSNLDPSPLAQQRGINYSNLVSFFCGLGNLLHRPKSEGQRGLCPRPQEPGTDLQERELSLGAGNSPLGTSSSHREIFGTQWPQIF
jgi:hypothetical protein